MQLSKAYVSLIAVGQFIVQKSTLSATILLVSWSTLKIWA